MQRVGGIGIQHAQTAAVIVSKGSVGLPRCWAWAAGGSGHGCVGIHHGAPHGGVAEAEEVAEFVSQQGFEVVSLRR